MKKIIKGVCVCFGLLIIIYIFIMTPFGMEFILKFTERKIKIGFISELKSDNPLNMSIRLPRDTRGFPLYSSFEKHDIANISSPGSSSAMNLDVRNDSDFDIQVSIRPIEGTRSDGSNRNQITLSPRETVNLFNGDVFILMQNLNKSSRYVRNANGNFSDVGAFISFRSSVKKRGNITLIFSSDEEVNLGGKYLIYSYLGPDAP